MELFVFVDKGERHSDYRAVRYFQQPENSRKLTGTTSSEYNLSTTQGLEDFQESCATFKHAALFSILS